MLKVFCLMLLPLSNKPLAFSWVDRPSQDAQNGHLAVLQCEVRQGIAPKLLTVHLRDHALMDHVNSLIIYP